MLRAIKAFCVTVRKKPKPVEPVSELKMEALDTEPRAVATGSNTQVPRNCNQGTLNIGSGR
jgi:hypothetical protein